MNKHNQITLGSLFDGIGGFPYAGSFFGIKPLWASEIMPQAISVTKRHLPDMAHAGDITALDGAKLPPVDIITFGSPCQGLSMAGRRLGLADERSGLFAEAIRIIEEMREETNGKYPRYAIWENVPGALSSNSGFDYKAVLEAFAKAEVPIPRSGKWANAGMVRGDGIDLAWCVYNAQYFGVPQRRRRIFLVCDFGGRSAGEVLFVAKSLSGYFTARGAQGQAIAAHAAGRADGAGISANVNDTAATIFAGYGNHWNGNAGAYDGSHFALSPSSGCLNPWDTQQSRVYTEDGLSPTLAGADGGGRNPGGLVIQDADAKTAAFLGGASAKARSIGYSEELSPTLKGEPCGFSSPCVCEPVIARTLTARGDGSPNIDGGPNIVAVEDAPAITMRLREGCDGGGKGPLLQRELCGTLAAGNDQYLFSPQTVEAYPISTQIATRHKAMGEGTGFGVGNDGDPAYTLQQAHSHGVAVGVHQNQFGDVNTAPTAYALSTNGNASSRNAPLVCENIKAFSLDSAESNSMKSKNPLSGCRETETARTLDTSNPCPAKNQGGIAIVTQPLLCAATAQSGAEVCEELCPTITEAAGKSGNNKPYIVHPEVCGTLCASASGLNRPGGMGSETDLCVAYCLQGNMIGRQDHNGPRGNGINEETAFTLTATDVSGVAALFKRQRSDSYTEDNIAGTQTASQCKGETDLVCENRSAITAVDCRNYKESEEISGTLMAKNAPGYSLNFQNPVRTGYIVRRLLPVECERLQGYPDGWTEFDHTGKPVSDTRRYQMLGNSVAVPCVAYILLGIAEQFGKEAE